jgi:hypothetical protein
LKRRRRFPLDGLDVDVPPGDCPVAVTLPRAPSPPRARLPPRSALSNLTQ